MNFTFKWNIGAFSFENDDAKEHGELNLEGVIHVDEVVDGFSRALKAAGFVFHSIEVLTLGEDEPNEEFDEYQLMEDQVNKEKQ